MTMNWIEFLGHICSQWKSLFQTFSPILLWNTLLVGNFVFKRNSVGWNKVRTYIINSISEAKPQVQVYLFIPAFAIFATLQFNGILPFYTSLVLHCAEFLQRIRLMIVSNFQQDIYCFKLFSNSPFIWIPIFLPEDSVLSNYFAVNTCF